MLQTKKHFTLIELLVVVAIIGILASLLLPVLGEARKKSKLALCTSNLKQMGMAIHMYTSDNDGYFPYSGGNLGGTSNDTSWDDRLGYLQYDGRSITAAEVGNRNLLTDSFIYECPANEVDPIVANRHIRSYALNYGKSHSPSVFRGLSSYDLWSMKDTEVRDSSQSIMITEHNKVTNYVGMYNNSLNNNNFIKSYYGTPSYWSHTYAKLNFGMIDGSVKFLSLQHTYLGLRDATASGNQIGTMWDCQD
ncbi:hypothetical protein LNTAR_17808 [Lentisphaera araneosa HTCC2155]|uniref:DUF1559 domain-containing protein n=1 Tax=Lentisphaera araneosa HTCC2155 TaxID=313628 RepID=A6DFQ0_9BACT|nr:DUF1559 domain-containing protein [Lentisphaera araneosa]EDM29630.1 hypothetical protein LNTAR_17808 [Lentisphaera araneosa HTCC2155]